MTQIFGDRFLERICLMRKCQIFQFIENHMTQILLANIFQIKDNLIHKMWLPNLVNLTFVSF